MDGTVAALIASQLYTCVSKPNKRSCFGFEKVGTQEEESSCCGTIDSEAVLEEARISFSLKLLCYKLN